MNESDRTLSDAERQLILYEWNDAQREHPRDVRIHELFEAQVTRTPEATAVVFGNERVSYDHVNRRANRLAHYLRGKGVKPEERVGICTERGVDLVVAVLAVLKAGGAYVPLDPGYPEERLRYMVGDSETALVLAHTSTADLLRRVGNGIKVVELDREAEKWEGATETNPERMSVGLTPGHLAYVIYTSGSTGMPKGVMLEHRNTVNLICWAHQVFGPKVLSRTLFSTSLNFDLAVYECFVPLTSGCSIRVVSNALDLAGGAPDVTLINTVPSVMKTLLEDRAVPATVEVVNVAGEPLKRELVERIFAGTKVKRICNLYGPTETTTYSTWVEMKREEGFAAHIGRPIANTRVYILDKRMDLVGVGVAGEIYIGGAGVARGYLNHEELTAESFVPDPYAGQAGARMYKTGDAGRWLADGNLEFMGRNDDQVKIRGFRIELGEIAVRLQEHPAVDEAVVLAQEDVLRDKQLVAYYVMNPAYRGSAEHGTREMLRTEQLTEWTTTYDAVSNEWNSTADPTFNIAGWKSSYTGQPIPAEEMREWLERTVERIKALQPKRVWEIGCGTGMLLFRIAPDCVFYRGTDISVAALNFVRQQLQRPELHLPQVVLECKGADEFDDTRKQEPFDLLLMNSVIQHFPDLEYLMTVLTGAVAAVEAGGSIFVGDVRSYRLLEAFHTAVQLCRAPDSLGCDALWRRVEKNIQQEDQLVIDPDFFTALPQRLPQINWVEINLKRGQAHNELTSFRYDVVLHVGRPVPLLECSWIDWSDQNLSPERLRDILSRTQPEVLGVTGIPNARVQRYVTANRILRSNHRPDSVGELRRQVEREPQCAIELEDIWSLEKDLGYSIEVRWSQRGVGLCDAVFRRCEAGNVTFPGEAKVFGQVQTYSNDPLRLRLAEDLLLELRRWLEAKLPAYMMPAVYVQMERMPLTSNGKLDRKALHAPEVDDVYATQAYEAPHGEIERALAGTWAELLHLKGVGRRDNFFALGGHSLMAARVVTRIRQGLGLPITMADLFTHPVLGDLAGRLDSTARAELSPIVRIQRTERLPLSFAQQRLWFLAQMEEASKAYHLSLGLHLRGNLDTGALRRALSRIVARHEALRTTFVAIDGEPAQHIAKVEHAQFRLVEHDLCGRSDAKFELDRLLAEEANTRFDLASGPLIRGRLIRELESEYVLLITMHHIVSDGWSMGIFLNELSTLYEAFRQAKEDPLPALAIQYPDYAVWERQWLEGEVLRQQAEYWKEVLHGAPALIELPTDHARPAHQDYRGGIEELALEHGLTAKLRDLSWRHQATLYMTLLAGWAALLSRLSGQTDVVIGTAVSNRERSETEGLIGFFVNTLALRVAVSDAVKVKELLKRVKEVALAGQQNRNLPFERVVDLVRPGRSLAHSPLFQVAFAWQNTPEGTFMLPGVEAKPLESELFQTAKFDLTLTLQEANGRIAGRLEYATSLFEPATIRRYGEYLCRLLEGMVAEENQAVSRLGILSEREREQVLCEWNNAEVEYPAKMCIHELFEQQVEKSPEATAVVFEEEELSYGELNTRANRLAHYLRELGVKPDARVAICVERGFEMIVGLLAVLKAGGAYVPLDPAYPQERLRYMLEDSDPVVLLTQRHLADRFSDIGDTMPVLDLADATSSCIRSPESNPLPNTVGLTSSHLAYVIYTSGSTGLPKGVMVEHRGLCNLSIVHSQHLAVDANSRILQFASFSFDACAWETIMALCQGAALHLLRQENVVAGDKLIETAARDGITHATLPPAVLAGVSERANLDSLRVLMAAGDMLPEALAERWRRGRRLINAYGPTETTICATMHSCGERETGKPSIGRPIANTRIYILDSYREPVPVGVVGELYIGGAGVARGYLNRAELTAERFGPDPFTAEANERMYKTGDLARWLSDGNIDFVGRNDNQVKIRGFRIELGEIEARLAEHPEVREAVVLAREDTVGEKRLVAYYTASGIGHAEEENVGAERLRAHLAGKLPDYMVPAAYIRMETLPLTSNGKLDRNVLPAPEADTYISRRYEAPQGDLETALAAIWAEVVKLERVGRRDNFFELGGQSLLALRVLFRVNDYLQMNLSVRTLLEYPVLMEFAQKLRSISGRSVDELEKIARTWLRVHSMTSEDLKAALAAH
jgi:amino acid adenylation domain-containing protein